CRWRRRSPRPLPRRGGRRREGAPDRGCRYRSFDHLAERQEIDTLAGLDAADAFADLDQAVGLDHRGQDAGAVAREFLGGPDAASTAHQPRAHEFAAIGALLVAEA